MTIDELIKELEKIKEEHGNLDVIIWHRHDSYDSDFMDDDLRTYNRRNVYENIELLIDDEKHYVAL